MLSRSLLALVNKKINVTTDLCVYKVNARKNPICGAMTYVVAGSMRFRIVTY
jgi:hypothetical protein